MTPTWAANAEWFAAAPPPSKPGLLEWRFGREAAVPLCMESSSLECRIEESRSRFQPRLSIDCR
jgi:hypothetical protein